MRLALTIAALGLAACQPTARAPAPPSNQPATPPTPIVDVTPAPEAHWRQLLGAPIDGGCVALDRAGEALCITRSGGLQAGTTFSLAWLSPAGAEVWDGADVPSLDFDPVTLPADVQARAVARLVKGGYGEMPPATWSGSLGDAAGVATIDDAATPVRIAWTRTAGEHIDSGEGAWTQYHDVVKSERPVACTLADGSVENPSHSELAAWRLPDGAVLVERDTAWAIEGDRGGDTVAQMLSPGQPCPK